LRAYRGSPLSDRLHATVRWWSAPFPAVQAALPSSGRILEIGCGHGLFCTYVALAGRARTVRGVDIDEAKIGQAARVAEQLDGVDLGFEVATSGTVATGPWDAIVIVDMLYLLPAEQQRDLLTAAAAELAPGGELLIKEMSPTPRWKAHWNILQETMSVSILGITERVDGAPKGDATGGGAVPARKPATPRFDLVDPEVMAGWLRDLGLTTTSRRLDRHYLHPHHLLIGRRPG